MKSNKEVLSHGYLLVFTVLAIVVLLVVSFVFKVYEHPSWIDEGGVIEVLSAVGYFLCALLIMLKGGWAYIKKYNYFLILMVLFGLRELDFDKRFTAIGILKGKFYRSDDISILAKSIGLLVIALILYVAISIIKNHYKGFFSKVVQASPVHVGALLIFLTLVFAKTMDGIGRKLGELGIMITEHAAIVFEMIEEVMELGIPLLILTTYFIYFSREREN